MITWRQWTGAALKKIKITDAAICFRTVIPFPKAKADKIPAFTIVK
jgi:hypothetical protein